MGQEGLQQTHGVVPVSGDEQIDIALRQLSTGLKDVDVDRLHKVQQALSDSVNLAEKLLDRLERIAYLTSKYDEDETGKGTVMLLDAVQEVPCESKDAEMWTNGFLTAASVLRQPPAKKAIETDSLAHVEADDSIETSGADSADELESILADVPELDENPWVIAATDEDLGEILAEIPEVFSPVSEDAPSIEILELKPDSEKVQPFAKEDERIEDDLATLEAEAEQPVDYVRSPDDPQPYRENSTLEVGNTSLDQPLDRGSTDPMGQSGQLVVEFQGTDLDENESTFGSSEFPQEEATPMPSPQDALREEERRTRASLLEPGEGQPMKWHERLRARIHGL